MKTKNYTTPLFEKAELASSRFFVASTPPSPSFSGTTNEEVTKGDLI